MPRRVPAHNRRAHRVDTGMPTTREIMIGRSCRLVRSKAGIKGYTRSYRSPHQSLASRCTRSGCSYEGGGCAYRHVRRSGNNDRQLMLIGAIESWDQGPRARLSQSPPIARILLLALRMLILGGVCAYRHAHHSRNNDRQRMPLGAIESWDQGLHAELS